MAVFYWIQLSGILMSAIFFSFTYDLSWLIPFAAGNFLYIGATDLVPEVNKHAALSSNLISFAAFTAGLAYYHLGEQQADEIARMPRLTHA